MVVGRALRAIVLHRDAVDRPGASRVRRVTDSQVNVVHASKVLEAVGAGVREGIEGQHVEEPVSRLRVVQAARVGDERPERDRVRPDDRRRIAEETVQRRGRGYRRPGCRVHAHDVVDDLKDARVAVAVGADAQALVGRLQAELVRPGRRAEPLVEVVEAVEAGDEVRVRGCHRPWLRDGPYRAFACAVTAIGRKRAADAGDLKLIDPARLS